MNISEDIITVNGENVPMTSQDIRGLLAEKGIDSEHGGVAVAVNGAVVPRAEWDQTPVKPNDNIEIVHIVRGG
jgi:sulfur carrier protein